MRDYARRQRGGYILIFNVQNSKTNTRKRMCVQKLSRFLFQ